MKKLAGLLLLVMLALPVQSIAAQKNDYQLCNETSYVLDAAIARPVKGEEAIETSGWHRLFPGHCQTAFKGALAKGTYYIYARSIDAHRGAPQIFGGDELLCTHPLESEFALREHVFCHMNDPNQRGEKTGFTPIQVNRSGWTTRFSPRQAFSSRRHAIVAGIQRLLEDNGYEIGTIDGYAGKVTLQAVKSFQRRHGLPATGVIGDKLFDVLIAEAARHKDKTGLHICNDSHYHVWSAVGYRSRGPDPQFESNGWIQIPPHACRQAIHERLEQASYYIYAQALDEAGTQVMIGEGEALIWGGDFSMCVAQTRFRIRGLAQCAVRGYDEAGFRQIAHHGAPRFIERLALPEDGEE